MRVAIGIALLACCLAGPASAQPPGEALAPRYIVVLAPDETTPSVVTAARDIVTSIRSRLTSLRLTRRGPAAGPGSSGPPGTVFRHALRGFVVQMSREDAALLDVLEAHPAVAYVAPDSPIELHAQIFQPGMQRIRARRHGAAAINDVADTHVDVDIAILDTGIDATHPDLNVFHAVSFVPGDPTAIDPHGHGTHVAGIAAAVDDADGVHGVAPGARLWAVKVADQFGTGNTSDVILGLDHVVANADQIDVVNLSLGGSSLGDDGNCGQTVGDPLHQAICAVVDAGVVVVASAGNLEPYGRDASLVSPACYDEVITVSAVVETDGLGPGRGQGPATIFGPDNSFAGTFSNYGWDVDLAAPGVQVVSTWPGGGYSEQTGTSMAAPHVTGAAALWIAVHGKPVDRAGVLHVRDELVRLAFPQFGPDEGFSYDREWYAEPLLNVGLLDPVVFDPVEPRLEMLQPAYDYGHDTAATVSVFVQDEQGGPLAGLPANAFRAYLNGQQMEVGFEVIGQGFYVLSLDIEGLLPGDHALTVMVRNVSGFERSAGCRIIVRDTVPRVMIRDMAFIWPVMSQDSFFPDNPLHATLTDERGAPLVLPAEAFASAFSGGGPGLVWSFPFPNFVTGLFPGITYGIYESAVIDVHSLPLGTYHVDLVVTHEGLSAAATAAFEMAYPEPALSAVLTSNLSGFDFTQTVPPPGLDLRVDVRNEWSTGVGGLLSLVEAPLTLELDGDPVGGVEFVEDSSAPGSYDAVDVDLSDLANGPHTLRVRVVDTRGLAVDSNLLVIDVIRETEPCSDPLAAGGQADADGDGFRDECDNCPGVSNPSQRSTSSGETSEAGLGDACKARASLWVSSMAADNPDFQTIQQAVDQAMASTGAVRIVILPGAGPYAENVVVDRDQSFRFTGRDLGSGVPVVEAVGAGGTAFDLRSAGPEPMQIRNLGFRGQGVGSLQRGIRIGGALASELSGLRFEQLGTGLLVEAGTHHVERIVVDASVGTGVVADDADLTLGYGRFQGVPRAIRVTGPSARTRLDHLLVAGNGRGEGLVNESGAARALELRHSTLVNCGTAVRDVAGTATIAHSVLWSNGADVDGVACRAIAWSDLEDLDCGDTNRSVVPGFVDPGAGDFRLGPLSPLLDHGPDPGSYVGSPCTDLDGRPRLLDHDGDGLARVDPGAYERESAEGVAPEVTGVRFSGPTELEWIAGPGPVGYHVYRSRLSALGYADFGDCADGLVVVGGANSLTDAVVPPVGDGFYYEITLDAPSGDESSLGLGTCAERSNFHACP